MLSQHRYGFGRTVPGRLGDIEPKVTEALKAKGFGVLTRIDVAGTLKSKLGEDMRPYVILGACNPKYAHQALSKEPEIGLLLPCNVVLYEEAPGQVHVSAMDPEPVLDLVGNAQVEPIAQAVRGLLREALESL